MPMDKNNTFLKYAGKFIVFEGIDGCGKSTQARLLSEKLNERGRETVLTKEPYKNESLKRREDLNPLERQRFFVEDRLAHLKEFIIPNLEKGINVISDRYCFSTIAYGMSEGVSRGELIDLHKDILGNNFTVPDLTIFIDLEAEKAIKRIDCRNGECGYFEREDKLRRIRQAYLDIYYDDDLKLGYNVRLISSDRPVEDVSRDVLDEALKIF